MDGMGTALALVALVGVVALVLRRFAGSGNDDRVSLPSSASADPGGDERAVRVEVGEQAQAGAVIDDRADVVPQERLPAR